MSFVLITCSFGRLYGLQKLTGDNEKTLFSVSRTWYYEEKHPYVREMLKKVYLFQRHLTPPLHSFSLTGWTGTLHLGYKTMPANKTRYLRLKGEPEFVLVHIGRRFSHATADVIKRFFEGTSTTDQFKFSFV